MEEAPRFLEICLPCPDVAESLAWYLGLGFTELPTTDARDYPYAVVTDGTTPLGLHGAGIDAPGLIFVRPELAGYARRLEHRGKPFLRLTLGQDQFHETVQADPEGSLAVMVEARTFSSGHTGGKSPATGNIDCIQLPCLQLDPVLEFWHDFGFIGVANDATRSAELHIPGLRVELHEGTRVPCLLFGTRDLAASVTAIERHATTRTAAEGVELVAPEGTRLRIVEAG